MAEPTSALHQLANAMGVATSFVDGLGRHVDVAPETLVRICAGLGAELTDASDATSALRAHRQARAQELIAPVLVAWDGQLLLDAPNGFEQVAIELEDGTVLEGSVPDGSVLESAAGADGVPFPSPLPPGYHELLVEAGGRSATATVIASPSAAWRRPGTEPRWGIGAQLAALWSSRSRSVGDLADLTMLCDWIGGLGGSFVNLLPLLPTFNDPPVEPSPYSPVSRLFWSELVLDLREAHRPAAHGGLLDVARAAAEVRAGLTHVDPPEPASVDPELARYAAFRGAQKRLGRDWRSWPDAARRGRLEQDDIDPEEARFHLVAQSELDRQLAERRGHFDATGIQLGLDLAVGVHPDGYDSWSRADLFVQGMSVGAPPDAGFPSGQSWGFPPVHPNRSRREGHRYFAASVAHHAALADVLRVDHIMAMHRLYWIPNGMGLADGTYVQYPVDEMFAVLCLESHRNRCEVIGENLGTVPPEIDRALERHGIRGMYLAEFEASAAPTTLVGPSANDVAMIDTHDTPLFAGWLHGVDIGERVELGLLQPDAAATERTDRVAARRALEASLGATPDDEEQLLRLVLEMLGESASPLVVIWLEDLWLERDPVNIPGSGSADRPNWARPLAEPLESVMADPSVLRRLAELAESRSRAERATD